MVDIHDRVWSLFDGPGRTRAALRAKDWSQTPLGPVESRPEELLHRHGYLEETYRVSPAPAALSPCRCRWRCQWCR
jgi:hypothetical protein